MQCTLCMYGVYKIPQKRLIWERDSVVSEKICYTHLLITNDWQIKWFPSKMIYNWKHSFCENKDSTTLDTINSLLFIYFELYHAVRRNFMVAEPVHLWPNYTENIGYFFLFLASVWAMTFWIILIKIITWIYLFIALHQYLS